MWTGECFEGDGWSVDDEYADENREYFYTEGYNEDEDYDEDPIAHITHWMYFPDPPEEN